jgi:hypothetical protein
MCPSWRTRASSGENSQGQDGPIPARLRAGKYGSRMISMRTTTSRSGSRYGALRKRPRRRRGNHSPGRTFKARSRLFRSASAFGRSRIRRSATSKDSRRIKKCTASPPGCARETITKKSNSLTPPIGRKVAALWPHCHMNRFYWSVLTPFAEARFNKVNGLAERSRTAREPLLARRDNAHSARSKRPARLRCRRLASRAERVPSDL